MQHMESHKLGTTITEHILLCEDESPGATGQFTRLLTDLISGAKLISREVNKAGLVDIIGVTGEVNVQGEKVRKLDEFADLEVARKAVGYLLERTNSREEREKNLADVDTEMVKDFTRAIGPMIKPRTASQPDRSECPPLRSQRRQIA